MDVLYGREIKIQEGPSEIEEEKGRRNMED
jgi:hypothetical protein